MALLDESRITEGTIGEYCLGCGLFLLLLEAQPVVFTFGSCQHLPATSNSHKAFLMVLKRPET